MNRIAYQKAALANLGLSGMLRQSWTKHVGTGPMKLTSKHARHPLYGRRHSSDLMVFNQIFVEREYSCLDHLKGVRTILDLGANAGFSSAYFLSRFPEAAVLAVEPDAANFQMLKRNTAGFGNRITCLEGAVWSSCTTLNFAADTLDTGAEWGRQTEQAATGEGAIQAWDVPALLQQAGFAEVDILKIDVEGAETAIFAPENDLSWLQSVRNIVIELHGPECDNAFFGAIRDRPYRVSTCGELTVCVS